MKGPLFFPCLTHQPKPSLGPSPSRRAHGPHPLVLMEMDPGHAWQDVRMRILLKVDVEGAVIGAGREKDLHAEPLGGIERNSLVLI